MDIFKRLEDLEKAGIKLAQIVGRDVRELRLKIEQLESRIQQLEKENDRIQKR